MLHITNGDNAAELISQSEISGHILPWRDGLHEGPVPAGLHLRALSQVRARIIIAAGWAPEAAAPILFEARDSLLHPTDGREDVVLWFEAELQVLDAALIAAAQKVEHYEIAAYGTLRTWAEMLGHSKAAKLFQTTLDEEAEADEKLTELAKTRVNAEANSGGGEEAIGK